MPGKEFNNPKVMIGTYDLSTDANKATVSSKLNMLDITPFGSSNVVQTPSLGDATMSIEFFTDFRAGGPNEALKAFHIASKNGTPGTISVTPVNTTLSATNLKATMLAWLPEYVDVDASVGAASMFTAEFQNAGTAGITWGTV
jgi:hypothetical protein